MTNNIPDNILSRVQKLFKLAANNANVNEAANAAAKAQQLIDQYNLDMAVLAADKGETELSSEKIDFDQTPLYEGKKAITWKGALANAIARANNCRVFLQGGNIRIVGKTTGVALTRFLFDYVCAEVERLCDVSIKRDRDVTGKVGAKTWANNFKLGAATAVADNLAASQREVQQKYAGTQAMVIISREGQAVEAFMSNNIKLRNKEAHKVAGDASARAAGYQAGKSIDLNRTGLGASASETRLIG